MNKIYIKKKHLLVLFLALIGISCQTTEQDIQAIENDLIPTFYIEGEKPAPVSLQERMAHHNVPGISVAVYRNGELAWAKGYGVADGASNRAVTEQTLFQAASISKPVAAMAALDMSEDGLIDLDTNINEYLESWELPDNAFTAEEKVTVRRLLNHSAGTTVWGFPGYSRDAEVPDAIRVVSGQGNTDSVVVYKTPGESWQYSGGGYTVMQIALSDVADKPFEAIMKERVLDPLEMNSSTYAQPLPEEYHERAATGYRSDSSEVEGKWHVYPEQAAAGLWTTPTDLGRYAVSVQQAISGNGNSVLEQATVEEMLTPGDNNHGLGPGIRYEGTFFGHGGSNEGYRCDFVASMDGGNVVVIMTNSDNGSPLVGELMQAIFRHYEWSGPEPTVKSRIALSTDYLQLFVGTYNIPNYGDVTLELQDGTLTALPGDIIQNPITLVPENDSTFFDASEGTTLQFSIHDSVVMGFEVQGLSASKIDQ